MIKVGIFGATGRIGRLLIESLCNDKEMRLESIFVRNELQYSIDRKSVV